MTKETKRQVLRRWLEAEIDDAVSVDLPELTNKMVALTLADEDFLRGLVDEMVRPFVYEEGKKAMARTREEPVVELGDEIVVRSEFEQRARVVSSKFARWMEHSQGRYVKFMTMDKADLIDAAEHREARANSELAVASLERTLAGKLREGEVVQDRFTPEQLDEMWQETNSEKELV